MKNKKYHYFTEEEKNYIFANYKNQNARQLSDNINKLYNSNISMDQVNHFKVRNKLKSGIPFKCWELPNTKKQREAAANNLRKFNYSRKKQIGYEYTNVRGINFVKYKDEENKHDNYMRKSRYIYEQSFGKIPKGYSIFHIDGDHTNDNIENLILLKKSTISAMNLQQLTSKNKLINQTAIKITELQRKNKELKKQVI